MADLIKSLFQTFQNFLVPFLLRNLLKIGGSILIYTNWSNEQLELFIAGIVSVVLGIAQSWIRDKWLKEQEPVQ